MVKDFQTGKQASVLKALFCVFALVVTGTMVGGCDSGPAGSSSGASPMEAKIGGTVADHKGPVADGKIEVKDKSGSVVATSQFTDSRYSIAIPASASYPIVITAYPAPGSVSVDPVKAVVTSALADRMDVSSVTTYVVDNALALGGLTAENIAKASGGAIGMRQAQGVGAGAGGSGGGPGNSGGGAGKGGHAGHNMSDMSSGSSAKPEEKPEPAQQ